MFIHLQGRTFQTIQHWPDFAALEIIDTSRGQLE